MIALRQTVTFSRWFGSLRDSKAQTAIAKRLVRLGSGLAGDVKAVGDGVMELRIHLGPGYRIYYTRRGAELILLLCGGDKGSQVQDIETAKRLAAALDQGDPQ